MIVRRLDANVPLAAALEQLASEAAAVETWVLPGGTTVLDQPLDLDLGERTLHVRGGRDSVLELRAPLVITAGELVLRSFSLQVKGAAIGATLTGPTVVLERIGLSGEGTSDTAGIYIEATEARIDGLEVREYDTSGAARPLTLAAGSASVSALVIDGVRGSEVVGLDLLSDSAHLADVRVRSLRASDMAIGALVRTRDRAELTRVRVHDVAGGRAVGIALLANQEVGAGSLALVDLEVSGLAADAGPAVGVATLSRGGQQLRGLTVKGCEGSDGAHGALIVSADAVDLSVGSIRSIKGAAGAVCGARVLVAPSLASVEISDLAVEAVWGVPPDANRSPREWELWSDAVLAALFSGVDDLGSDALAGRLADMPSDSESAGLAVDAPVDELDALLDEGEPGPVAVIDSSVRRVTGTGLQVRAGLRTAQVRRFEGWTLAYGGALQAEELLLAELTFHRCGTGLRLGWGEVWAYNSLLSALEGPPLQLHDETDLAVVDRVYAQGGEPPLLDLSPLPYVRSEPLALPPSLWEGHQPPSARTDLRLAPTSDLIGAEADVPGDDDAATWIGAHPPSVQPACGAADPEPRAWLEAVPPEPSAIVDYRARDAAALLERMLARADVVLPSWTERGAADLTTMLFELFANRLDHLSYAQERAVQEGYLQHATLRRSVEDHARALDYSTDPGLSSTAMLRFHLPGDQVLPGVVAELERLSRREGVFAGETDLLDTVRTAAWTVGAGTLVANASTTEASVIMATQDDLRVEPALDRMSLEVGLPKGAFSAVLAGRLPALQPGRWLVFDLGDGEHHVVRVVSAVAFVASTEVAWDPRRPIPRAAAVADVIVFGNVVPAHHGVPLAPLAGDGDADDLLRRYREQLTPTVDGSVDRTLDLSFGPVSVIAPGWPFPGEDRRGAPQIELAVEGERWRLVDDLSLWGPGDEVYTLRPTTDGGTAIRFGDGVNGAALPAREVGLEVSFTVGLGRVGNVGADVLTRLIRFAEPATPATDILSEVATLAGPDWEDLRRSLFLVHNPLPATGGRDAESLDRIRYRAPLLVVDPRSAVSAADYVRLVEELPEVAGARARIVTDLARPIVRVTVLLADEDELYADERLRRWALVRQRLEDIRLLGFDVESIPPVWVPIDLDLVVDVEAGVLQSDASDGVRESLAGRNGMFDPDVIGLGGDVHLSDLYQQVLDVPGVTGVRVVHFRRLEPRAVERFDDGVIPIADHEVAVLNGPSRPSADGLLTITVCGGVR